MHKRLTSGSPNTQYAQELLSTFSLTLGEVTLQPSTGGTFVVTIHHRPTATTRDEDHVAAITSSVLWNRKVDGGFPETKELKRRVRDVIEPGRNLGHVDRNHGREHDDNEEGRETGPVEGDRGDESNAKERAKAGATCDDCAL
ncbi:hypothetical protein RJ55_03014 [Drechmeria coniospora]|nr:hypothetical protein RJ55_03014 [Drechmeria coniospora]